MPKNLVKIWKQKLMDTATKTEIDDPKLLLKQLSKKLQKRLEI